MKSNRIHKGHRSTIEALEQRIAPAGISSIDLGALNGTTGIKLTGTSGSNAGDSIANAGDVNGDGIDDVIIGAPATGAGAAYVVFGSKTGVPAALDLSTLNGTNGFKLTGETAGDMAGGAVAGIGDFNGDGYDDIAVGAELNASNGLSAGAVYVVYGRPGIFPANIALGALGNMGTKISAGTTGDLLGFTVAGAGDVNGDGLGDLLFSGAGVKDNGMPFNGAAYVVFGKAGGLGSSFSVNSLTGTNGFKAGYNSVDPNFVGDGLAGAGDINGDGFDDVIITASGAPAGGANRGAAFVLFGKSGGFPSTLSMANLSATSGFRISGVADGQRFGTDAAGLGDVNGDGYADFAIGASGQGPSQSGAAYVFFGRSGGFSQFMLNTDLDGTNGFRMNGLGAQHFLGAAGGPGDFNGDGLSDVFIGAPGATEVGANSGATYIVYGKKSGFSATLDVATLDGANGLKLRGAAAGDNSGLALAAGDFNGDGFSDAFVGAPFAGASDGGAGFIAFGSGPIVKFSKDWRTATFTEADGDLVTVKVTKGKLNRADFDITGDGVFQKLSLLDTHGAFNGSAVTITAKKAIGGAGDGKVNVGAIDARGTDLSTVMVSGNLGQIDAGDGIAATPGLVALKVGSLGGIASTQPAGTVNPFLSRIEGSVKSVTVAGDASAVLDVDGKLGTVKIGRDLTSASGGSLGGLIRATGDIASVTIGRHLVGGSADISGVMSGGKLGKVFVGDTVVTNNTAKPALITALGKLNPTSAVDAIAIGSVTIKGGAAHLRILAGVSTGLVALNGDAGIGSVAFSTGIVGVSIAAGVADTSVAGNLASAANGYGRNDTALGGGNPAIVSRIGKILFKFPPISTPSGADSFAATAQQIAKVLVAGKPLPLTAGKDSLPVIPNSDMSIVEL